jgi:hypothetical protein
VSTNKRKSKKLRRPNVPMGAAMRPLAGAPEARGGGLETAAAPARATAARPDAGRASFDYTYVKKDLRRIGILAGSFIAGLVALSFFIR